MKYKSWISFLLLFVLLLQGPAAVDVQAAGILYVKPGGSGDCSNWTNACTLQIALGMAGAGDEIWVAEGTHTPTDGTDRTATFQMKNGVALYGGFEGTETSRDQRDWTLHETILSGDIGVVGDNSDNCYHVVTGGGTDATALLDGLAIIGGRANGDSPDDNGGGMYNEGGGLTLVNVTFSSNSSVNIGGGMYNWDSSPTLVDVILSGNSAIGGGGGMGNVSYSSPQLIRVTFSANSAGRGGGMMNFDNNPMLVNVTFSGNSAQINGGGMYNYSSTPTLTNVSFSRNSAQIHGGAMRNSGSNFTLTNSILWGNTAPDEPEISNDDASTVTVSYSLVQGGYTGTGNVNADPQLVDAPNGDLHLHATSPAINAGNNDALPADSLDLDRDGDTTEKLPFDLDGNPRIANGKVDMGVYEFVLEGPVEVTIDIKSGSHRNSINCNNEKGVIAVAILTTEDFDATTVDHTTVTFEGASETHIAKRTGEPRRHEEDVDYDGDMDLVFHFRLGDTSLTCDSTEGTLIGETFDGQAIEGSDAVRMIKRSRR